MNEQYNSTITRIVKSAASMFIGNGMSVFVQLMMVPILISAWGVEKYGEWILLFTIPAYLAMADFGVITVALNKIQFHSKTDTPTSTKTFISALLILTLAFVSFLCILGIGFYLLESSTEAFFKHLNEALILLVTLLVIDSFLSIFTNFMSGLYRIDDRYHVTINIQNLSRLLPLLAICLGASMGGEPIQVALISIITKVVILLLVCGDCKSRYGFLFMLTVKPSFRETKHLFHSSTSLLLLPISNILYLNASVLIFAAYFGSVALVMYTSLRTMTRFSTQVVAVVGKSWWSEISRMFASNDKTQLTKSFKIVAWLTIGVVVLIYVFASLFGEQIYDVWLGGQVEYSATLFHLLLLGSLLAGCWSSLEVFLLSTNTHSRYVKSFFVFTLFHIGLGWMLSSFDLMIGLPLAGVLSGIAIIAFLLFEVRSNTITVGSETKLAGAT